MNLVKELENIADTHNLRGLYFFELLFSKVVQQFISLASGAIIIYSSLDIRFIGVLITLLGLLKIIFHVAMGTDKFFSFYEDWVCWRYTLSSSKKKQEIREEVEAYLKAKEAPQNSEKGFSYSPSLLDDDLKLAEWVAKYVRKETSIVNHFVSRFGNPVVKDMHFIRLLIWSQLIPIKKFDLNALRMVLAANPDINNQVLTANNVPLLSQEDIEKMFSQYSSHDLTILLTGDFSIENYLNVLRRSFKMGVNLPVMKSVRELVKHLHFLEEKDFVVKEWQNKIVNNNVFEFTEAITTKEALLSYKAYFKNCIETYARRLGAGEGMLFVAYQQGHPYIVFYVDDKLHLGDATYKFNKAISLQDRNILQSICLKART